MTLRLISISAVLLVAALAGAMNMRTHFTPLAFSADGRSLLLRSDVSGPEGGESHEYQIWSASAPHRTSVRVASDLGQGGRSKAEATTVAAIAAAAAGRSRRARRA
jgi:hypothetical protein